MADKQINELPSGGALQDADLLVLQRSGTAYNVAGSQIAKQSDMTTAEGDINTLTTQMADAIRPYNDALYFATDLNALAIKATFVRFSPETLNIPVAQKQGYCLSIRSSANYGSQMAQTNNDDTIWVRTCQGGTWSAWRQLALKSESTVTTSYLASTVTHHANITDVERVTISKSGHVVVCDMVFTVGTAIAGSNYQAELFSGLPTAVAGTRFRCFSGTTNAVPLVLQITTDGKIINQWSNGGIPATQYQCSFTYMTND